MTAEEVTALVELDGIATLDVMTTDDELGVAALEVLTLSELLTPYDLLIYGGELLDGMPALEVGVDAEELTP